MCADTLYIVMPAYNEAENIQNVVNEWYPIVEKYGNDASRLLILDDGSRDDTARILEKCREDRPRLLTASRANRGHGATVGELYRRALESGADYVFQTDSDGQTRPEAFPPFWNAREQYDLVIGWRKGREDGFPRKIVTHALRLCLFLGLGVWVKDANTPFRLMRADTLDEMLRMVPEGDFLTNALLTAAYTKTKKHILYLPIPFRPRQGGKNSIRLGQVFGIGRRALKSWRSVRRTWKNV